MFVFAGDFRGFLQRLTDFSMPACWLSMALFRPWGGLLSYASAILEAFFRLKAMASSSSCRPTLAAPKYLALAMR